MFLGAFSLYEICLIGSMLFAPQVSDVLWWSFLTVFVWTIFTLLRVIVRKKNAQIACNLASSLAVLSLVAVSWRLSDDWRLPVALSVVAAVWLITLVVEGVLAIRRSNASEMGPGR